MHLNNFLKSFLAAITFAIATTNVLALESDAEQEITIESERAEFDRKAGTATYIGNVILLQGTLKIDAQRIVLYTNEQQKLNKAVATGSPAHFQQQMEEDKGLTTAQGNSITYITKDKTIELNKDATLEQEGNLFSGDHIVYDILSDSVSAKGGTTTQAENSEETKQRVKMVIQPADNQEAEAQ